MTIERWRRVENDAYGTTAAAGTTGRFEPPAAPQRVVLDGPCPRCGDPTRSTEPLEIVAPLPAEAPVAEGVVVPPSIERTVAISCQCTVKHPGRPKSEAAGCGARWALRVNGPLDMNGTARVEAGALASAPTAEDEAAAATLASESLATARKTAENWRTGLLLLAGLVTTFTAVKGADSISKLADPAPFWLAVVSVGAIGSAVVGSLLSLAASFGLPGTTLEVKRGFVQDLANWKQDEAARSGERIWQATIAAVLSVALLVVAIGITWFGATRPSGYLKVGVAPEPVCGKLTRSDQTSLTVTDAANVEHPVAMADVRSLEVVTSCD